MKALKVALVLAPLALSPARAEDEKTPSPDAPLPSTEQAAQANAQANTSEQLQKLDDELAQVMDELVTARARAGVLAQALFRTALEVEVIRRADDARLEHVSLRLDGVPIHDSDGSALARDRAQLFEGYVAPGMHELAIELHERDKESAEFGYVRSERFRIDVKHKRRTHVELIVRDDSDMAEEAKAGDDGEYQVSTELRVRYEKARD